MKAAPVMHALNGRHQVRQSLVHTGQHYDANMSHAFFSQLEIPAPDVNLEVGSGSPALKGILGVLLEVSAHLNVVFPVHPRTRERMATLAWNARSLQLLEPLPYIEFLALQRRATVVITDSGGIQEETTYLGVPCLTLRKDTDRPVTVNLGTNVLVGQSQDKLRCELTNILEGKAKSGVIPPLWDGHAGERIAEILCHAS